MEETVRPGKSDMMAKGSGIRRKSRIRRQTAFSHTILSSNVRPGVVWPEVSGAVVAEWTKRNGSKQAVPSH